MHPPPLDDQRIISYLDKAGHYGGLSIRGNYVSDDWHLTEKKNMHLRFNFICQAEDWKDEASGKAEICLHFFPGATNDL